MTKGKKIGLDRYTTEQIVKHLARKGTPTIILVREMGGLTHLVSANQVFSREPDLDEAIKKYRLAVEAKNEK